MLRDLGKDLLRRVAVDHQALQFADDLGEIGIFQPAARLLHQQLLFRQRVGLNFGGPYLGLFGAREKFTRQMPGRLCGETVDADGKRGFVLTLSTRGQHSRREKATSNICTNSGLCALAFSIHMTLLGGEGLGSLARINHARALEVAERLGAIPGVEIVNEGNFFNEFTLRLVGKDAREVAYALTKREILGGVSMGRLFPDRADMAEGLLLAVTETVSDEDIDYLAGALQEILA